MTLWERYWRFRVRRIAHQVHGKPARGGKVIDAFAYAEGAIACRACNPDHLQPPLREDLGSAALESGVLIWGLSLWDSTAHMAREIQTAFTDHLPRIPVDGGFV